VSEEVYAAAVRLRKRGSFSERKFRQALSRACAAAKIPSIGPGRFRHAIATWAVDHGSSAKDVATFLGHRSERTLRRFYAVHGIAKKVPTLR
jgi:integrase